MMGGLERLVPLRVPRPPPQELSDSSWAFDVLTNSVAFDDGTPQVPALELATVAATDRDQGAGTGAASDGPAPAAAEPDAPAASATSEPSTGAVGDDSVASPLADDE
jgi:hypothetical protein